MASRPQADATSGYALVRHGCGMLPQAGIPCSRRAREPTAERTIPHPLSSSAAVVRTLFTPKIKDAARPLFLAEGEGFEPPEAFTSTVFKTAAIDRSAILPYRPPQRAAVFCCFGHLRARFSAAPPLSESVPKRRPAFGARSSATPRRAHAPSLNDVRRGRRAPKCPRPSACR